MKHWIWTHPTAEEGPEDWKQQFARFRDAGLHAATVLVFNGREAIYGSGHLPVSAPQLEQMLPVAAAAGLELHAWIVALRCNAESLQQQHPEWYSVSRNGDSSLAKPPYIPSYQWLCPSRPEVREWLGDTVTELAAYDGLAGIHLDYIRHPDVILPAQLQPKYGLVQDREFAEYDFCYCDVCREEFRHQQGVDPVSIEDPAGHESWVRFRCDSVKDTVAVAAEAARSAGKTITAAVFATPTLSRKFVRQDWPQWDLDAVLPMIYHYYYNEPPGWVGEATGEGVAELAGVMPLYSGLFVSQLSPPELRQAAEGALSGGASGISLFSHRAMSHEHWPELKIALSQHAR